MNTHRLILPKMPIMANASRKPEAGVQWYTEYVKPTSAERYMREKERLKPHSWGFMLSWFLKRRLFVFKPFVYDFVRVIMLQCHYRRRYNKRIRELEREANLNCK